MKAWSITAPFKCELVQQNRELQPDETKVKVTMAALTETDISAFSGKAVSYPVFPGKLAVGLVSEVGSPNGFRTGEKVFISPYVLDMKRGALDDNILEMGRQYNGLLGDFVIVPTANIHRLPDGVTESEAVFIDYVAVAVAVIEKLNVDKTKYVVILGCNTLSIIFAQLCVYYQAIPIIVDDNEAKLDEAQSSGIYYTVNSAMEDAEEAITSITGGNLADYVMYECREGDQPADIFKYVKSNGTICVVSNNYLLNNKQMVDIKSIYLKQLNIVGVNNGCRNIRSAINLLANKAVNLSVLSGVEDSFTNLPALMQRAYDKLDETLKAIVLFD